MHSNRIHESLLWWCKDRVLLGEGPNEWLELIVKIRRLNPWAIADASAFQ